jgi:hypothetical protein
LCLVAAGRGAAIPLKDVFDQPETMWMQFRRRLDHVHPYCRIASHTEGEVRDIRDLSRKREISEQFVWLNRQYGETEAQLSRSAITPSIRADSSQDEGI